MGRSVGEGLMRGSATELLGEEKFRNGAGFRNGNSERGNSEVRREMASPRGRGEGEDFSGRRENVDGRDLSWGKRR